eukprot:scaffold5793_cov417-Prasinococcus_capsulatus_cf.AAC.1
MPRRCLRQHRGPSPASQRPARSARHACCIILAEARRCGALPRGGDARRFRRSASSCARPRWPRARTIGRERGCVLAPPALNRRRRLVGLTLMMMMKTTTTMMMIARQLAVWA